MEEKVIVSLADLRWFADMLIAYGRARDFIEAENCGMYLKDVFLSEDEWLRKDVAEFNEGLIEYK
jgi:hypothetical protein